MFEIDIAPDRHSLDADPDPAKLCGSDPIRIQIHNTGRNGHRYHSVGPYIPVPVRYALCHVIKVPVPTVGKFLRKNPLAKPLRLSNFCSYLFNLYPIPTLTILLFCQKWAEFTDPIQYAGTSHECPDFCSVRTFNILDTDPNSGEPDRQ